jgi:hypothetical protein
MNQFVFERMKPKDKLIIMLLYLFVFYKEGRIPFMLADCLVIFSLHMLDRGLKAEKHLRELKAEKEATEHESKKAQTRDVKKSTRLAQRQAASGSKNKASNMIRAHTKPSPIMQPDKKRS